MTLPDERYRAMMCGNQLILDLLDSKKTPRVPKEIRARALGILRHYPSAYHFEMIAELLPDHFSKTSFMVNLHEKTDV